MGRNFNFASSYDVLVHVFLLLACSPSFSSTQSPPDPCSLVQCGQGSCKISNSFPFFECECYPGWTKPHFLTMDLPFCIIPNCNISMQCGDTNHPPPPATAALLNLNITDPCFLVWCGEGQCARDGVTRNHTCECNDGFNNLLSLKGFPCFKECSLGADCKGVSFGRPPPPPSPPAPSSSPPHSAKGSGRVNSCATFLLAAVALVWI